MLFELILAANYMDVKAKFTCCTTVHAGSVLFVICQSFAVLRYPVNRPLSHILCACYFPTFVSLASAGSGVCKSRLDDQGQESGADPQSEDLPSTALMHSPLLAPFFNLCSHH